MPGPAKVGATPSLSEVFQAFSSLKVLIIGDVMIDSYLWGKVERISPEAPVPVLHVHRRDKRLGGAANVALNVQSLGATPVLCSVLGNDADAVTFCNLLQQSNLAAEGIVKSDSRITTVKHRVMSGAHHMLRVDEEMDHTIDEVDSRALFHAVSRLLPDCDIVIFEDYDKGVIHPVLIHEVMALAKNLSIPVVVDPKKRNFLHYQHTTLFKPNKKELKEGLKLDSDLSSVGEIESAVALLQRQIHAQHVLITLSEKGCFIASENNYHHVPAHVREISDVSGAGDTVIAIAALCVALELSIQFISELSNLGGGLVCEHVGVVPVSKDALFAEASKIKLSP